MLALLLLTIALAGPTHDERIPRNRATVILVIDVSLSMKATDVEPTRLAAAQEAAKSFADGLTPGINLGLVAFAGTASVLVSPTTNREATKTAIDKLQLAERTATGEGIFTSLQSIDTLGAVLGGGDDAAAGAHRAALRRQADGAGEPGRPEGRLHRGPHAKDKGVPISTISFGTSYGYVEIKDQRMPVPVDDAIAARRSRISPAAAFTASSLEELQEGLRHTRGADRLRDHPRRRQLGPGCVLGVLCSHGGAGARC